MQQSLSTRYYIGFERVEGCNKGKIKILFKNGGNKFFARNNYTERLHQIVIDR